ncbi:MULTISPECIES: type II toxin-antitoxin system VapC family toxin [unclassified Anabaena]|uniref:type II toxin-antitoxin system VapC family toxin n=1 Tax=unclassified Anabaena TaxID=2619674 RepID=UPI001444CA32|nr:MULTISPECIES: type II toxin-antitoxin system VapC family toxin [unclassified Anabaena]MTJ09992.1 type II toxin-antitoxin system VapC family toxin [Anabaena sp. UHCC 0204]MTJ55727.1 type II toxin-antitoxin system VapC family toxin [Anabaena sp. UHCC 0253]
MNGNRYVLDTNAIIALLQGNTQLIQLLQNANWIGISIISQIEFLVFSGLTESDIQLFQQFIEQVEIVGLTASDALLVEKIIEIRQQYRLKLPDAVIAAITIQNSASLVTADQEFAKINTLPVINW